MRSSMKRMLRGSNFAWRAAIWSSSSLGATISTSTGRNITPPSERSLAGIMLMVRADDEDAVGPHVQRWADRGDLAHGSIAEIFAMELHGLKYQWDRGRGHDVLKTDFRGCADAPRAPPRRHRVHALIKRHRLARAVAGTGDTQRMQVPLVDRRLDATEFELFAEQLVQRRAIEQGVRIVFAQASEHHGCKPARTGGHHTGDVGTEDLLRVKVFPHVHQPVHAEVKVCGVYREGRAVNGTR